MKLEFFYVPTSDLPATLALYRDHFGFTELWREGETTVALSAPGGNVNVMLDADPDEESGPTFSVDLVADFHANRPDVLEVRLEPSAIPGGFFASYREPGGSVFYVVDQSTEGES
ncbi:MAG: VOC family protein [Microbacterium sp.]|uniref:VOC family protein n=1 Tax=Microbacterium sp. TaxID=51671 RepID=UPI0039E37CB4